MKQPYQGGARMIAQRQTIFKDLFTLKDGEDRYYLVPDFSSGVSFRLLGTPIDMNPNMPAAGADSLSLAYANFGRAYTIVDRTGLALVRDQFTGYPLVKFRFGKRMGGDVENFEAIKIYKLGT